MKSLLSRGIGMLLLASTSVWAKPIGGWSHRSRPGKTIALDSPLGIAIIIGVGILLVVITLLVVRALKRRQ